MAIRQMLRGDLEEPISSKLQVDQDGKERHKAVATNAGREDARTGDAPDKIHKESLTKGKESHEKQLRPKSFKILEKLHEHPWEVQRTMAIRQLLKGDQLQVTQDVNESQKATNAAKENARTGDDPDKIHKELHTKEEESHEKPLRPKPFKIPEKFYEYPWEVQRTMAIRQMLRGDLEEPVTPQLQVDQDEKERQKATNADKENASNGDGPDKIHKESHTKGEESREKPLRNKLREVQLLGHVAMPLQVSQDLKKKHKADLTNAAREKARTGDYPAKIQLKLQIRKGKMAETRKELLTPFKVPEKFYGSPRKKTSWWAMRQLLRGDLFGGPVTAQQQVAQEKQKTDLTNAGRKNTRTGNNPAKIRLRLHTGRGEVAEPWKKPLLHPRKKLHAEKRTAPSFTG